MSIMSMTLARARSRTTAALLSSSCPSFFLIAFQYPCGIHLLAGVRSRGSVMVFADRLFGLVIIALGILSSALIVMALI
jgi:hypothetical protein